jgi:hypothetical protein
MSTHTATGEIVEAVSNVVTGFKAAIADGELSLKEKLKLLSAVMGESDALARAGEIDDELKAALRSPAVLRELLSDVEEAVPETGTKLEDRLEALADFLPHFLTFYSRLTGKPLDVAPVAAAVEA